MTFYMKTKSVEDNRKRFLFNIFMYNVQPGIDIEYKTGKSSLTKISFKNNSTTKFIIYFNIDYS